MSESLNGTAPILEARDLRKVFKLQSTSPLEKNQTVKAVEQMSLALHAGRVVALVGESGSGKTTVARVLAGMYDATAGTIHFSGELIRHMRGNVFKRYRKHVQYIFQDPFSSLNPVHTIEHHLARPLKIHGYIHNKKERHDQIVELLERVNLTPAEQFIGKYPHELSGGQRQRIAIARALAVRPDVLLADEPVSMLDVSIRLDILNLLSKLKDEDHLAILYITHDIASARYFADDTQVMYAGQMVEGGPSDSVIREPKHPYTQVLLAAAPDAGRIDEFGNVKAPELPARGEPPSLINPPTGCRFHPRCSHAMAVCRQRFPARTDFGDGHWTHCHLYDPQNNTNAEKESLS
jgi:peptide/nickel transport system ATP-binding protein